MKTLLLTVLVYEGPISRAYLVCMRRAGFLPRSLVLMVQSHSVSDGKAILPFLPKKIRSWIAEKKQDVSYNYWPRYFTKNKSLMFKQILKGLETLFNHPKEILAEMYSHQFRFEDYAENTRKIMVKNLKDPLIPEALTEAGNRDILFTGGGIVPANLLDFPGVRFLHIHPGHLPDVRGADGLLWSTLLRGVPGASCFYLAKGIDTGDLIEVSDYPNLSFLVQDRENYDDQTLYRALFSFCDPLLRSRLWVDVLEKNPKFPEMNRVKQNPLEGITYHFMQPPILKKALEKIFVS